MAATAAKLLAVGQSSHRSMGKPRQQTQRIESLTSDIRQYAQRFSGSPGLRRPLSPHLAALEAESIHIMREVAAEFERPVMLYSIGKDSAVMLHLALKAFYPARPPFPLQHVDTTWKFRDMISTRISSPSASARASR